MTGLALLDLPLSNDPTRVLAHSPASASCLPITVLPIPASGELPRDLFSLPRIFVAQQGVGQRWYQLGGKTRALSTAPRMIEIYEGGLTFDHCSWSGEAGRSVLVQFADADVQAMTHGEVQRLELRTRHEVFDDRISQVTLELGAQAMGGMPDGRLYVQGLCVALLGLLVARHSDGAAPQQPSTGGRLGPLQQRRVAELIACSLGADLSLTRLAEEVGLSVRHFVRAFKASFGATPHRYVRQCRLEAAAAALRAPGKRSIAQIALDHGFASQGHMTELMRRSFGVTPRTLQRREPAVFPGADDVRT